MALSFQTYNFLLNQTEINSIFVAQFDISDTLMQYLLVPNPPKPLNDAPNPPNPADANYHNR